MGAGSPSAGMERGLVIAGLLGVPLEALSYMICTILDKQG